jgi:hypothetical protein
MQQVYNLGSLHCAGLRARFVDANYNSISNYTLEVKLLSESQIPFYIHAILSCRQI